MEDDPQFAVVDVETTGLSPKKHDKIVEIAILTADKEGNHLDSYETLINPDRDVSASHVHGITGQMVKEAPKIDEVVGDIAAHLDGKTMVCHNIPFDSKFISHELSQHLGQEVPLDGVCTMRLAGHLEERLPSRKLENLCEFFDIEVPQFHSAYWDCKATLDLFKVLKDSFLEKHGEEVFHDTFLHPVQIQADLPSRGISFKRSEAEMVKKKEGDRIAQVIHRLPSDASQGAEVDQYWDILDRVLADRVVTSSEEEEILEFAKESGLTQYQAIEVHREYLRRLIRVYLLDEILSDSEYQDLLKVSELLSVDKEKLDEIIEVQRSSLTRESGGEPKPQGEDLSGKSVCFTGQLTSKLDGQPISREQAQQYAMERGMIVKNSVSKKLDYLVTADPDSLSGKAKKAREYGVEIIAEPVFWNRVGVMVE